MAALLDRFQLRRHALPAHVTVALDRELDRRESRLAVARPARRRHLVATWHVGADTRPICTWSLQEAPPVRFALDSPSG
jgi:hypothetical protein